MANLPFDRTILNVRERALSSDINQAESQLDYSLRFALQHLFAKPAGFSTGFLGAAYKAVPNSPAGMSVLVSAGLGLANSPADVPSAIGGIVGLDDLCAIKPLVLNAPQTFAVPANGSGNPRIDIIEVKVDRRAENPTSRLIYNAGTGAFDPTSVNKTLAFSHDGRLGTVADPASSTAGLSYKTGTPAGVPVAPATTAGYVKIAEINVAAGATSITASEIVDRRPLLGANGMLRAAARFRLQWNGGAPTITDATYQAPPGVQIIAAGDAAARGQAFIFVVGGEISGVSTVALREKTLLGSQAVTSGIQTAAVGTVTTLTQTTLAGLGVSVAVGAKYVEGTLDSRFVNNGGTVDNTNAALEDLRWDVHCNLTY